MITKSSWFSLSNKDKQTSVHGSAICLSVLQRVTNPYTKKLKADSDATHFTTIPN